MNERKTIVLIGTLDTKGDEIRYVKNLIEERGLRTVVVDTGVLGEPQFSADVPRERVAAAGGTELQELVGKRDRGLAGRSMSVGAAAMVGELLAAGRLDGALAVGGGTGGAIGSAALRSLPLGIPKVLVIARGDGKFGPYIGRRDIAVFFSVTDILGLNPVLRRVLSNAAGAISGMVEQEFTPAEPRPSIGLTTMGVTTPAAMRCRELLLDRGYEVLAFPADGAGGRTMEELVEDGVLAGVIDLTTSELADELCGGTQSAGPDRLEAAARRGVPQIVVPGAIDFVNFSPHDAVPPKYAGRLFYDHSVNTRLMRTTVEESAQLGHEVGEKVARAAGPVTVVIPARGFSDYDHEGRVFFDPEADRAFVAALKAVTTDHVRVTEVDLHVNDPEFADVLVKSLVELMPSERKLVTA